MAPGAAQKLPPPPTGDQLVSWSQLYRYMDNPFDVMLFSLAVAGSLGSGACKPGSPQARARAHLLQQCRAAALARGSALPHHAVEAQTARSRGSGNLAAGTAVVPATDSRSGRLAASLAPADAARRSRQAHSGPYPRSSSVSPTFASAALGCFATARLRGLACTPHSTTTPPRDAPPQYAAAASSLRC
jgi:hypothetical protein